MLRTTIALPLFLLFCAPTFADPAVDWPAYGNDPGGMRYSTLDEVNRDNATQLKVAWTYRTGDLNLSENFNNKAAFECTPIVVDGMMYITTPASRLIALDAATGEEKWTYDPEVDMETNFSEVTSRGVSIWTDSTKEPGDDGYRRVILPTLDARLIALDAATGMPVKGFGNDGTIDLHEGIKNRGAGQYQVTSPPAIINDIIVTGSSMGDNRRTDMEEGVVRGYDARTGKQRWSWDPIPRSADAPHADTWEGGKVYETGAANVWSLISADPERGLVFLPTTSPSPDHFGGERKGANVYANCVVALRAETGEVAWHFQTVHHDLWDYDLPCQPLLTTIRKDGEEIPVVIQGTKSGHVFVLHRETGEPVFPVEERAVPQSDIAGEASWPTQPFPTFPAPLLPDFEQPFTPWAPAEAAQTALAEQAKAYRYEGRYTPPSRNGSIQFPSTAGGINWGGLAFDPERQILVANPNRIAHLIQIIPRDEFTTGLREESFRGETAIQWGTDYGLVRRTYLSDAGMPATPPPWGLLIAIDFKNQTLLWEKPIGSVMPGMEDRDWGSPQMGGATLTAGGLIIVAATRDGHLRAIDINTGDEIWRDKLPVPAQSTPMTYRAEEGGKQFIAVCAGGHGKFGTPLGDYVVAYALPD